MRISCAAGNVAVSGSRVQGTQRKLYKGWFEHINPKILKKNAAGDPYFILKP